MSMQESVNRAPTTGAPEGELAWKRDVYLALCGVIGARTGDQILGSFRRSLTERLLDPNDSGSLRRDAHSLCSTSGLLGFERLSNRARALEQICDAGGATAAAYAAALADVRSAQRIIDEFLTWSAKFSTPPPPPAGDRVLAVEP